MRKLNLGSGRFPKKGYINVDLFEKADLKCDLNKFPYPFKENSFDVIEADHVLEHLEDPFKVMKEIHRIAKNNAKVIIRVPHFSRGFTNPEHKRGFDINFPYYFNPSFKGSYQGVEFKLESLKLKWFAQPYLKKTVLSKYTFYALSVIGKIINFIANIFPPFCTRIWCFWVGGFEEIEFCFKVIK